MGLCDALPVKIATWNVNGIRARHAQFLELVQRETPDVLCLQEIKASPEQVPGSLVELADYVNYWHGQPGGYSGVSLHVRRAAFPDAPKFSHPPFDTETRAAEVTLGNLVVLSVYLPNGGKDYPAKLEFMRQMEPYARELCRSGKKILLCGDLNVARHDIDVHPSQRKPDVIGQRAEERALFEAFFEAGLVDVQRKLHPDDERLFTWWPMWKNARPRNLGWRIDYILASAKVAETARTCDVLRDYGTSDHAPVVAQFDVDATEASA
jgi:exodeoxyribonuclease-3